MRPVDRDSLPHLVAVLLDHLRQRRDTAIGRLRARWWGIELAPGVRFLGQPLLRRFPGSTIRLGEGTELRSARWSNQVGLDRPCMISTLAGGARVTLGRGVGMSGTVIGAAASVTIGDGVLCGANCTITDTDWHPVDAAARAAGAPAPSAPVVIEDGVWLSMNVTVLKGVTIGAGTVVAAGSVVSRSLPAGVIAAGSPAVPVRPLRALRSLA
ncbi:MAG TPA: acyltransferase [Anaeromyxobacteraceae bacterium]|nr:acyltransferase [Anaeromyxobacteraceae bacterium]